MLIELYVKSAHAHKSRCVQRPAIELWPTMQSGAQFESEDAQD